MSELVVESGVTIPEISDDELNSRIAKVRALRLDDVGRLVPRVLSKSAVESPRNTSFLWDAEEPQEEWSYPKLKETYSYVCYHTYGYYGFFKPTLAEVFAQMPEDVVRSAFGFTIKEGNTYAALTPDQAHQWSVITVYERDI